MKTKLIIGLLLVSVLFIGACGQKEITNNSQKIYKVPLNFQIWQTLDIKEVSFNITKTGGYNWLSVTDCMDYLRENYEDKSSYWITHSFQCVLDKTSNNFFDIIVVANNEGIKDAINDPLWRSKFIMQGDCRCEYAESKMLGGNKIGI